MTEIFSPLDFLAEINRHSRSIVLHRLREVLAEAAEKETIIVAEVEVEGNLGCCRWLEERDPPIRDLIGNWEAATPACSGLRFRS